MKIAGIVKNSLCDYPGRVASVIFTSGCNLQCPYCHNYKIIDKISSQSLIDEGKTLAFLEKRKNLIKNVVISGGEPCFQKDLITFVAELRNMGFNIKLDTNGCFPETLGFLVNNAMIDYVAMDIKAPLECEKMRTITGLKNNIEETINKMYASINILNKSNIRHEFRSTLIKEFHNFEDITKMVSYGLADYKLQQYSNKFVKHNVFSKYSGFSDSETDVIIEKLRKLLNRTNISHQ